MQTRASQVKYALATASVVMLSIFVDYMYLSKDEHDKHLEQEQVIPEQQTFSSFREAAARSEKFSFVDIKLPEPVKMQRDKVEVDVPISAQEQVKEQTLATTKQTISAQMISSKVAELANLEGANQVLYFPGDNSSREMIDNAGTSFIYGQNTNTNILAFMHQCIGLGLAALDGESLILLNKPKQSAPKQFMQQYSQLMRVVSGTMLNFEQNLRSLYAPNKPLVRLFPRWFDQVLGYQLAKLLVNTQLTQFSAQYKLLGDSLWLTNIKVNGQSAQQDWLIKQGC